MSSCRQLEPPWRIATFRRMETILSDSASLKSDLEAAQDLYDIETIITTKIPMNVMCRSHSQESGAQVPPCRWPQRWPEISSTNSSNLLPGYRIFTSVFDDECDIDKANRAMVKQYAGADSWVGVAGMGCSVVCESLSVIT